MQGVGGGRHGYHGNSHTSTGYQDNQTGHVAHGGHMAHADHTVHDGQTDHLDVMVNVDLDDDTHSLGCHGDKHEGGG